MPVTSLSTLGLLAASSMADSSGGNEVWRSGWVELGVDAAVVAVLRRLAGGPWDDRDNEGRFLGFGRLVW